MTSLSSSLFFDTVFIIFITILPEEHTCLYRFLRLDQVLHELSGAVLTLG
jgi:hypothetical protein